MLSRALSPKEAQPDSDLIFLFIWFVRLSASSYTVQLFEGHGHLLLNQQAPGRCQDCRLSPLTKSPFTPPVITMLSRALSPKATPPRSALTLLVPILNPALRSSLTNSAATESQSLISFINPWASCRGLSPREAC